MSTATSGHVVDDFENSFQASLAALTNPDHFNVCDSEEVKTGVEQTIQRFLDVAKQVECFFLQKRLLLSVQKPEHIILEREFREILSNNSELKNELARKEQLLQKYYEKIQNWQNLLKDVPGTIRPPPLPPQSLTPQSQLGIPGITMIQGLPIPSVIPPQAGGQAQSHPHHMMPPHCMPQQSAASNTMILQNPQIHSQPHMVPNQQQPGGLQGPLAYLERNLSNIGMPDAGR